MTFSCGRSLIVMQFKKTNKQKKKTPKNQENKDGDLLVISG